MPDSNIRLMTKIAILYYKHGMTYEAIAARLGISRQKVGRFIDRAREEGLVTVQINSPLLFAAELETKLEKVFDLEEARVVSPAWEAEEAVKEALGMAGADFLECHLQPGDTLGVSWGSTVLEVARHLKPMKCQGITVVQLNGSMDVGAYSTRAEYMAGLIANALDARMVTFSAPMLVDRPEILASLLSDSRVAAALGLARTANIALFGVGDLSEHSSPYKAGYYSRVLLDKLRSTGAVGEICGRFYDRAGRLCSPDVDNRTLAVELENLRKKPLAVAIAGLPHKIEAIEGMLHGRYCNVLITDEETARALLSRIEENAEIVGGAA